MGRSAKSAEQYLADAHEIIRKKNAEILELKRKIDLLQVENDEIEDIRVNAFQIAAYSLGPPKWVFNNAGKSGSRGAPMTVWSDFHYGEVINADEIGGVNAYNKHIAKKRFQLLVDRTIDLCFNHMGKSKTQYPGIIVCLGGDMVGGDIHEELMATNDCTTPEAVRDLAIMLASGLDAMARRFGRVFVPAVVGNHGRTTRRSWFKKRVAQSFDWLLYCALEAHFWGDDRIRFYVPRESDARFTIFGHRFLLTHGDSLGVKGGDGIIGALGPIMRGLLKVSRSEAQIGREFDTGVICHWHQYLTLPGLIVNNSFKGYDEYARLQLRAPYSRPSQALWFTHPEHGITAHWQVYLDKQRQFSDDKKWVSWPQHAA